MCGKRQVVVCVCGEEVKVCSLDATQRCPGSTVTHPPKESGIVRVSSIRNHQRPSTKSKKQKKNKNISI